MQRKINENFTKITKGMFDVRKYGPVISGISKRLSKCLMPSHDIFELSYERTECNCDSSKLLSDISHSSKEES